MFGSLFGEERSSGVMTNVHKRDVPAPTNRRSSCGLSGIENQGATCYLNSLLQTLLYTPEFREGLFALSDAELGSLEKREREKVRIIPLQLQRLFARLLLVDKQAASTTELTDSFGWSNNEELQQHDVQELNRILFSAIDSSLVGTSGKDLISHLYHGLTISEIVCQICGKISEKEEDFLDLNVIVANFNNLQDSLNATFLQTEIMKGKNQYRCSTCCNLVDAKKGLKIKYLPPILTLSLLRFSYDIAKGERFKETRKFAFPFEIDMGPYCNKDTQTKDSVYELFSVLIHSGCSSGGHYHAYIRDVDSLGKWHPPNEEPESIPSSSKENIDLHDPVSVVKTILQQTDDRFLPIEFLSGEIIKMTGGTWNKKFKSSHGTITSFLHNHSDTFHLSDINLVFLNENVPEPISDHCASGCSAEGAASCSKETKKNAVMNTLKINLFDKKRAQNNNWPVSESWYDFNDSTVSPIPVKNISKQFSGKESAYMLFYRRKSLLRPEEAKCNPKYKMPEKLVNLADEESSLLEKQREEYENTVYLQVHLGNNYRCCNGVLESKQGEINYLDLAIDKRKLLLDLRDSVSKLCAGIYPSQDFVLHTARDVPAGLHLYEELSTSQNYESLKDLDIVEGTKIFVWDGTQFDGEHFAIGIAHEPILLNVSVSLPSGESSELSRGFPKTTTIGELKALVASLVPLSLDDIRIARQDLQEEESKLIPLTDEQDMFTLSELGFIDGDSIVIDSTSSENLPTKDVVKKVTVIVQNCCEGLEANEDSIPELVELTLNVETKIEDLKTLAVSGLNMDSEKEYILRSPKTQKKVPLHEHITIKEAGLSDGTCLTIEEGTPPNKDQITLRFSIGVGQGDCLEFELTICKDATVMECFKQMLQISGLNGDSWHICKTNWCGEPMEQLPLDESSLAEESLQHGENLLIMEGRIPAKGFLTFTIFLFPTLEMVSPTPLNISINGLHNGIENLLQSFGEALQGDSTRSLKLGEVELSSESTISELKNYVLTLPSLSSFPLPDIRYLRLQILDNGKPGRVLRGLSNTLKKLKLSSQSLAARILYREEDLMNTELLLNICQRIPDTQLYTPAVEMIWDTSKSASPKALKQVVSDCLACPLHRLVLAKHDIEHCKWLVIDSSSVSQTKFSRKKRWGAGKSNVRNAPYYVKDGDTLGVKDRINDPEETDDFMTREDIEGQKILRIAAENKRLKKEEKSPSRSGEWMLGGSDRELPRHAKMSEVGITIHVDDFT